MIENTLKTQVLSVPKKLHITWLSGNLENPLENKGFVQLPRKEGLPGTSTEHWKTFGNHWYSYVFIGSELAEGNDTHIDHMVIRKRWKTFGKQRLYTIAKERRPARGMVRSLGNLWKPLG